MSVFLKKACNGGQDYFWQTPLKEEMWGRDTITNSPQNEDERTTGFRSRYAAAATPQTLVVQW